MENTVHKVTPVILDHLVNKEDQVLAVHLGQLVNQGLMDKGDIPECKETREYLDLKEILEYLDNKALLVHLDYSDIPEELELTVILVTLEMMEPLDLQVHVAILVLLESTVQKAREEKLDQLDLLAHLDYLEVLVLPDHQEDLVLKVLLDHLVHLEMLESLDQLVEMEDLVNLDHLVLMVLTVALVFVERRDAEVLQDNPVSLVQRDLLVKMVQLDFQVPPAPRGSLGLVEKMV